MMDVYDTNQDIDTIENLVAATHYFCYRKNGFCHICRKYDKKKGKIYRCSSCHFYVHYGCINKVNVNCKYYIENTSTNQLSTTINNDTNLNNISLENTTNNYKHHWIYSVKCVYSCCECNIRFSIEPGFICSWCKITTHMSHKCRKNEISGGCCNFGQLEKFIVRPYASMITAETMVVDNFEQIHSVDTNNTNDRIIKIQSVDRDSSFSDSELDIQTKNYDRKICESYFNSLPNKCLATSLPVLIFVNPRSGGNMGYKILQKFRWHLNPQQIFDLSKDNWKELLKTYINYTNLHFIVCGGDGTVCWILSVIDELDFISTPSISIVPLGTGNDLSISLGWGCKYKNLNVGKLLKDISNASRVLIDRWYVKILPLNENKLSNPNIDTSNNDMTKIFQNYFSIGSDATIALAFHRWREKNKNIKTSRFRNRVFYIQEGGKVLTSNNVVVSNYINRFICDGVDYKQQIDEFKPCSILVLNISSYGGGTTPWGVANDDNKFTPQRSDDKMFEVLFFKNMDMIKVQLGSHAKRFMQCSTVTIEINHPLAMQYDGEPEMVDPSIIDIRLKNQAVFLKRNDSINSNSKQIQV